MVSTLGQNWQQAFALKKLEENIPGQELACSVKPLVAQTRSVTVDSGMDPCPHLIKAQGLVIDSSPNLDHMLIAGVECNTIFYFDNCGPRNDDPYRMPR